MKQAEIGDFVLAVRDGYRAYAVVSEIVKHISGDRIYSDFWITQNVFQYYQTLIGPDQIRLNQKLFDCGFMIDEEYFHILNCTECGDEYRGWMPSHCIMILKKSRKEAKKITGMCKFLTSKGL